MISNDNYYELVGIKIMIIMKVKHDYNPKSHKEANHWAQK